MILIVLFKFLDAKPILQCLWLSSFLPSCSFTVLETLSVMLFSYCHQLLSYVFSLNNSSVQQQTRMINVPWDVACYPRPLYSCLVVLPTFASARLSARLLCILCICLCQAFSVFCLLWAFCYALCWLAIQSCSLCGPWGLLEDCVHWVPWVCLFLKLGYAGYAWETVGAVSWP